MQGLIGMLGLGKGIGGVIGGSKAPALSLPPPLLQPGGRGEIPQAAPVQPEATSIAQLAAMFQQPSVEQSAQPGQPQISNWGKGVVDESKMIPTIGG